MLDCTRLGGGELPDYSWLLQFPIDSQAACLEQSQNYLARLLTEEKKD